ncbi:MAG TPA: MepB family protein [Flavobacteriaceae bacterium]|nr:MepB family protein [Flavobacteriaceae bacterium]
MNVNLKQIETEIYSKCRLKISGFQLEPESKEYDACRFDLNGRKIVSRSSKVTPKKAGQFVTFWKRNENGIIEPLNEMHSFDFYAINVRTEKEFGQFVFPKSVLVAKGIVSTENKEGKRGFRVYPIWDIALNKQATQTQKWQLNYFYEINNATDFTKVVELYGNDA